MNSQANAAERAHMQRVKELSCSLCGDPGPSSAHHIKQGLHYTVIALCQSCHQGPRLGWHGDKIAWKQRKKDEIDALNQTIKDLMR